MPAKRERRSFLWPAEKSARRAGFTLVEVIVVLVILAILAAIAIPALTGYIDKAQDTQYIAEARNASVAMKTVLSEAYGSGEITDIPYDSYPSPVSSFTVGSDIGDNAVKFDIADLSVSVNRDSFVRRAYFQRASALIGEAYPDNDDLASMKHWYYYPVAQRGIGATAATADGFFYRLYPEGDQGGFPCICVTFRLSRLSAEMQHDSDFTAAINTSAHYDPNAGYEIYKVEVEP
jgi:prepilin-type N-terminal cleavage/methylation domain-containing protein